MQPATGAQAIACARDVTRQNLGNLGQFLPCLFTWDDMILSEELLAGLQDLAYEARTRAQFWDRPHVQRLFPRGTGLTALLSGTPGTGKTMAAQVIAAELKLDLFRVDLARVVSKYIGETAKHLSEIFSRASQMSAILLFDEADALFAKRTQIKDAHDRYANADTGYLLQLLEEFRGLALLTTNKRGNIDPAFYRRLRYVYEFPKPGAAERLKVWQRLSRELYGDEISAALAPSQQKLAEQMPISPAQIKATLLASAFIAQRQGRPVQPGDLLRALEREMAKEGRGLDGSVRTQLEQP
jgi:SpoVK/Ycf46/Vps4 family AAA+-type ATPase